MSFPFSFFGRRVWRRGLCLLLLALCSRPALAQVYYVDINQQTLSLPERAVYVEQVLDGRAGSPALGLIYTGLHDKQVPALFRTGLEQELTAWLRRELPARPTDRPLVLCVRQLLVNEEMKGLMRSTSSSAALVADVYARLPDGYHFVQTVTGKTSSHGMTLNTDHSHNLAQIMQAGLSELAAANWALAAKRPARALGQLKADKPAGKAQPTILRAAMPRKGVYHSFQQFVANQPDTVSVVRVDTLAASTVSTLFDPNATPNSVAEWKGTCLLRAKVYDASGTRVPPRDVWGFSDGRHAYISQLNNFRLLTRQNGYFTFVGTAPVDATAEGQRAQRTAIGGAVGGAYAGQLGNTGMPVAYALNCGSGSVSQYPFPGQPQRPDTAFLYVYRPPGGPATPRRILLNDHEVGQLRPGEFLELSWPHTGRVLRLSVDLASGPALLAVPSGVTANYVKLVAGAARTPWQWMPAKQGEAEVDALERPGK
ncbi:MAG: hypothetical protein JWP58_713 [Hymenobacter sp.]|nr:hypothetical protein [Hymenobacter sp.]